MALRTEEIARLLPLMTEAERAEVNAILSKDKALWRPLPGPQSMAYHSEADIIGYGGAAGGGKTDLAIGKALTRHRRAMIMRREATQLMGIYDRMEELLGSRTGFNGQDKIWRIGNLRVEFGSCPNIGDERRQQGRPHDLLVLDEATNFLESQARFLMGWVRSVKEGQQQQTLLTFNPPLDAEGRWVIDFFGPWLDDKYPNRARVGEIRWFAVIEDRDMAVADGRRFVLKDGEPCYDFNAADYPVTEIIQPKSRTFIPSRVSDNPYLSNTGYMSQLQALPEPLRSQMLNGDFMAGVEDDPWQVIPTMWVDQAMARWQPRVNKGVMDSMGVDVARGGKDETIIYRRHGGWFDEAVVYPGRESPDGPTVLAHILAARRDRAPVHIDLVGWGASPYDFLVSNDVQTIGVNGAERSGAQAAENQLTLVNKRAELWWRMREALDPKHQEQLALPPDNKLRADLCAPLWKLTPSGIMVELKEDIIKRIGRSPDRGDAACMALMATIKRNAPEGRYGSKSGRRSAWA